MRGFTSKVHNYGTTMNIYGEQLGGSLVQNVKVAQGAAPRRQASPEETLKKEGNLRYLGGCSYETAGRGDLRAGC